MLSMLAVKSDDLRFAHTWTRKGQWIPRPDDLLQISSIGWDCGDRCSNHFKSHGFSISSMRFENQCPQFNLRWNALLKNISSNGTNEVTMCEKHRVRVMEEFVGREDDMFSTFEASSGF